MEDNINEIVLYEEEIKNEERIENSVSDIETISDGDYLLECARFGDKDELVNLLKSTNNLDINFKDERGNNALRKCILKKISLVQTDI